LLGCGDYESAGTLARASSSEETTATSTGTAPVEAPTVQEIAVAVPEVEGLSEEIITVGWGMGPGEVSLGEGDFGTGGPDMMAVSPDGKTIAVYDRYAEPRRVNFYANGAAAGAVPLEDPPVAIAINDEGEVYALYQKRPISELLHLATSGEVLETLAIDGALDPMGPLSWAGSRLYCFAGVGGTEDDGYLLVASSGSLVSSAEQQNHREGITEEYPLPVGSAMLQRDSGGGFVLTVFGEAKPTSAAHLSLPPDLAEASGFLFGSALGGLPVILFFSSQEGGPSTGCFVAVDPAGGMTRQAAVRFDWKVPGGEAVVGPDAVYVMRPDFETGLQLLRVPFR